MTVDILNLVSDKDRLNFALNLTVNRNRMGDTLFPNTKTKNLQAEFYRLSDGLQIPEMATVHSFDAEAEIGERQPMEKVVFEKLLIKRKINQTERVMYALNHGASEDAIVSYIYDDMGHLAENILTRVEVAKMDALQYGKMKIQENNVNLTLDYAVPKENFATVDWSSKTADVMSDIQSFVDTLKEKGQHPTGIITSNIMLSKLKTNETIQKLINGDKNLGAFISTDQLKSIIGDMFGLTITINDDVYQYSNAGAKVYKRYLDQNKFIIVSGMSGAGAIGSGLWGDTPDQYTPGAFDKRSSKGYINISQWSTPDPSAVWTMASGLFVPVIPNPSGQFIATVKL